MDKPKRKYVKSGKFSKKKPIEVIEVTKEDFEQILLRAMSVKQPKVIRDGVH